MVLNSIKMGYFDEEKIVARALRFRKFLDKFPKVYNPYFMAAVSCISGMMFGFDISSMSVFVSQPPYRHFFHDPDATMQGFITAAMSLGSIFGSICSSFVSEPFGRRASLFICGFLWCTGAAVQASSQNTAQLIVGRIISGWGVGFGSSVAPVYGSEMAPRKRRGLIGVIFQFSVVFGIFVMFLVGYGMSFVKGTASFRVSWGVQIVPGLVLLVGLFFIPESPRWLAKHGYWDDAEYLVAQIQAGGNKEDPEVIIEMSEIKDQVLVEEHDKDFTYRQLFTKKYRARTITAIAAQSWQQLSGINVMMYYVVYIFQMAGYNGDTSLLPSLIQYIIFVVMTVPAFYLLDKFGRRKVFLVGAALLCAWQLAVAGILGTYAIHHVYEGNDTVNITIPPKHKPAAKAVIAACYLFVATFALTWGPGCWLYCSEVWGDSASRQRGAAVSTTANWVFNFAIAMFTPSSFKSISWKTYFIYASCCLAMFFHVLFFFPETKGKRLEEIGQMWDEGIPAWRSDSWEPTIPILSDAKLVEKLSFEHREKVDDSLN